MNGSASFGYWVRRRRKALDLTQLQLAQRSGYALTTIRKIENDARRPSREMAERLADSLELAPAERAAFVQAARAELAADRLPGLIELARDRALEVHGSIAAPPHPASAPRRS